MKLAGRGRLVIPESFCEFLRIEPGEQVMVVGAAVAVEIWRPQSWVRYLNRRMPRFRKLLDQLAD